MKKYKLTIIENIVSGTFTKTREIKAKDEDDANKIFDELAHKNGWEEDYDDLISYHSVSRMLANAGLHDLSSNVKLVFGA